MFGSQNSENFIVTKLFQARVSCLSKREWLSCELCLMVDPAQAHVTFLLRDGVGSGSPPRELDGLIVSDPASESFLFFIFSKGIGTDEPC